VDLKRSIELEGIVLPRVDDVNKAVADALEAGQLMTPPLPGLEPGGAFRVFLPPSPIAAARYIWAAGPFGGLCGEIV